VPGPDDHFLINPFGLLYEEVTASNLVKVDLDGNVISGDYDINGAGFVIHSCIHRDAPHLHAVMHTHTVAGCAVSAQAEGLLPIAQTSMIVSGAVSYHDYEGFALDLDEQARLLGDLGDNRVMILRNHGLLTAGETVAEAFFHLYYLEQACRIQIAAQAGGALQLPSDAVQKKVTAAAQKGFGGNGVGEKEFAALVRRLDREDTSWRQ
jgi:ribulose-5-phosphate 4-epimerase/fuculose-1-phosphate aldolase